MAKHRFGRATFSTSAPHSHSTGTFTSSPATWRKLSDRPISRGATFDYSPLVSIHTREDHEKDRLRVVVALESLLLVNPTTGKKTILHGVKESFDINSWKIHQENIMTDNESLNILLEYIDNTTVPGLIKHIPEGYLIIGVEFDETLCNTGYSGTSDYPY